MPSTSTVTLGIQSYVGFKRPDGASVGGYSAPRPVLQTTETLDGDTFAITGVTANSKMLYVYPLTTFTYFPSTTSTAQTVVIKNSGTLSVSLLSITPSNYDTTAIISSGVLPITIAAGSTSSFDLSYYSETPGEFLESLLLLSTADVPYYRMNTLQNVITAFSVRQSTTVTSTTTTVLGQQYKTSIELMPVINGIDDPDTILDFTTSMSGSPGWTSSSGTNLVNLTWDPDLVYNVNNTTTGYVSTLSISVVGLAQPIRVKNTALVNIDYTRYKNLITWMSPAAPYNSLIGISFDIIDGKKTITIGVGAGGDGSPIYANGGGVLATTSTLGLRVATIDSPYPYWSTVCSIPLDDFPATYLSGALNENEEPMYIKKTTPGLNYADYFGFEQGVGSIFIVDHDGTGNVTIELNNLRELSGDAEFDATLQNLTRAFHYYSGIDSPARYEPQLASFNVNDPRTQLFRGFTTYYDPAQKWFVETSLVPIPT